MNLGLSVMGAYAWYAGEVGQRKMYLLGVAVIFTLFAAHWLVHGSITRIESPRWQATKVACFGLLFLYGFFITA